MRGHVSGRDECRGEGRYGRCRAGAGCREISRARSFFSAKSSSDVLTLNGTWQMGSVSSLPAGERKIEGDVMVVNHKDTIYALSPKCPHLGLPMKTGKSPTGAWCSFRTKYRPHEHTEQVERKKSDSHERTNSLFLCLSQAKSLMVLAALASLVNSTTVSSSLRLVRQLSGPPASWALRML